MASTLKKNGELKNPFRNPHPPSRWKKGQSGNPNGRRNCKGEMVKREMKVFTRRLIAETYNKYINCSVAELREAFKDHSLPAIEGIVAGALLKDRLSGQLVNTEVILDRTIGKVPNLTELGGIGGGPLNPPTINFVAISAENGKKAEIIDVPNTSTDEPNGPEKDSNRQDSEQKEQIPVLTPVEA